MIEVFSTLADPGTVDIFAAGLSELKNKALNDWVQPVFIVGVAAISIVFIKDRAWMKLLAFLGIAAIVGVVVFAGEDLFGDDGNLTGAAEDVGKSINTVNLAGTLYEHGSPNFNELVGTK